MNNQIDKLNKYAFLDRDGTLIFEPQDTFQVDSIKKLRILEGVIIGLKKLLKAGYKLIMVTNQDGLGTSLFPKINFEVPQKEMLRIFNENGIVFDQIFICPHFPTANCSCRKPKTGLVSNFLSKVRINKTTSFVCGDRATDKEFAKNLSVKFLEMNTNGNFYSAISKVIGGGLL